MSEVSKERRTINIKSYYVVNCGSDRNGLEFYGSSGISVIFWLNDSDLAVLQDELRPRIDKGRCVILNDKFYPTQCDFLKEFTISLDLGTTEFDRNVIFAFGSKKLFKPVYVPFFDDGKSSRPSVGVNHKFISSHWSCSS